MGKKIYLDVLIIGILFLPYLILLNNLEAQPFTNSTESEDSIRVIVKLNIPKYTLPKRKETRVLVKLFDKDRQLPEISAPLPFDPQANSLLETVFGNLKSGKTYTIVVTVDSYSIKWEKDIYLEDTTAVVETPLLKPELYEVEIYASPTEYRLYCSYYKFGGRNREGNFRARIDEENEGYFTLFLLPGRKNSRKKCFLVLAIDEGVKKRFSEPIDFTLDAFSPGDSYTLPFDYEKNGHPFSEMAVELIHPRSE